MPAYAVYESQNFLSSMEDAVSWLYLHNLEQSEQFAERKSYELRQEVKVLEGHLTQTPYMGQADDLSGLRRFPLYEGRYSATWIIDEASRNVTMLEFRDSKYPVDLRNFQLDES